jgi:hypothetical protein
MAAAPPQIPLEPGDPLEDSEELEEARDGLRETLANIRALARAGQLRNTSRLFRRQAEIDRGKKA